MDDASLVKKHEVSNVIPTVKLWGIHLGEGMERNSAVSEKNVRRDDTMSMATFTYPPEDMTISAVS